MGSPNQPDHYPGNGMDHVSGGNRALVGLQRPDQYSWLADHAELCNAAWQANINTDSAYQSAGEYWAWGTPGMSLVQHPRAPVLDSVSLELLPLGL